jgi:hypothetical protein
MTRGFRFCLVGSVVLVALAGCGRSFLQMGERENWRHEAELKCLSSGAVKETSALVRISPIEGPGICGADFPLKVAALGESAALAFAGEVRPPGSIPGKSSQPRWPVAQPRNAPPPADIYSSPTIEPPQSYPAPRAAQPYAPPAATPSYDASVAPSEPLSLTPPSIADLIEANAPPSYPPDRPASNVVRSYPPDRPAYNAPPSSPVDRSASRPPPELPALGPSRGPQFTGSVRPVEVKPAATLACPIVSALDQWIAASVQPSAMRWFGQPVTEIKQISAYSCRGMNGQIGARISEHAFGNALDIAAFTLADGRKVVVRTAWKGAPEEQGFLHDIQGAACQQFTTVLAPGSNRFHYDHIHVDLMRRSGRRQICQPAAIPGEVAARAAQRNSYAGRGDPAITGSVSQRKPPMADAVAEDDDHHWMESEPQAEMAAPPSRERFRD